MFCDAFFSTITVKNNHYQKKINSVMLKTLNVLNEKMTYQGVLIINIWNKQKIKQMYTNKNVKTTNKIGYKYFDITIPKLIAA